MSKLDSVANWTVSPDILDDARGLVSKETVVLRRWGRETQNFGFIN